MRSKFMNFMSGRNGFDALARFELYSSLLCFVICIFIRVPLAYFAIQLAGAALMVTAYIRVFSRNVYRRQSENLRFLNLRYSAARKLSALRDRFSQRKKYRFFRCPSCGEMLRVPKCKGKLSICCPKCGERFIRKT